MTLGPPHGDLTPSFPAPQARPRPTRAFTLLELILVMAVLALAATLIAPSLQDFFRGRTVESEARRLLALTRHAQSRAATEGLPMLLWFHPTTGAYGLEAAPGPFPEDHQALEFKLHSRLTFELPDPLIDRPGTAAVRTAPITLTASPITSLAQVPAIRFLPDGTVDTSSPSAIGLKEDQDTRVWLVFDPRQSSYALHPGPNRPEILPPL